MRATYICPCPRTQRVYLAIDTKWKTLTRKECRLSVTAFRFSQLTTDDLPRIVAIKEPPRPSSPYHHQTALPLLPFRTATQGKRFSACFRIQQSSTAQISSRARNGIQPSRRAHEYVSSLSHGWPLASPRASYLISSPPPIIRQSPRRKWKSHTRFGSRTMVIKFASSRHTLSLPYHRAMSEGAPDASLVSLFSSCIHLGLPILSLRPYLLFWVICISNYSQRR